MDGFQSFCPVLRLANAMALTLSRSDFAALNNSVSGRYVSADLQSDIISRSFDY